MPVVDDVAFGSAPGRRKSTLRGAGGGVGGEDLRATSPCSNKAIWLPANEIDPDAKRALLRTSRRGLQMVLRLLAHNAEHWLSRHVTAYLRDDDEYRAITRQTLIRGLAGVM